MAGIVYNAKRQDEANETFHKWKEKSEARIEKIEKKLPWLDAYKWVSLVVGGWFIVDLLSRIASVLGP